MSPSQSTIDRARVGRQLDQFLDWHGFAAHHPYRVLIGCPPADAPALDAEPLPAGLALAPASAAVAAMGPRQLVMDVDTLEDVIFMVSRGNSICEILEHLPTTEHATSSPDISPRGGRRPRV